MSSCGWRAYTQKTVTQQQRHCAAYAASLTISHLRLANMVFKLTI